MPLTYTSPLIELEPPSSFPRGIGICLLEVFSSGSDLYLQLALGLSIKSAKLAGSLETGCDDLPASINNTLLFGFSDNLFATAQPAEPAPTMI